MSDLPVPKFKVGDQIYLSQIIRSEEQIPCPDCLGKRKWSVTTPAGETFEVPCERCCGHNYHLPSIKVTVLKPEAVFKTIRSIEVRSSHAMDLGPNITYFDNRGCCGVCMYEDKMFLTEQEALAAAEPIAAEYNEKELATCQGQLNNRRRGLSEYTVFKAVAGDLEAKRQEALNQRDEAIDLINDLPNRAWYTDFNFLKQIATTKEREEILKGLAIYMLNDLQVELPEDWQEE